MTDSTRVEYTIIEEGGQTYVEVIEDGVRTDSDFLGSFGTAIFWIFRKWKEKNDE